MTYIIGLLTMFHISSSEQALVKQCVTPSYKNNSMILLQMKH